MRVALSIDQACLREHIAERYGLQVETLDYLPVGEVSHNFVAQSTNGRKYILKLLDQSRLARTCVEHLHPVLPMLRELRETSLLTAIPAPVCALDGREMAPFGTYTLVLLHYVEGTNPDEETLHQPEIWRQLARLVARLHRATDKLQTACPFVETYTLAFEAELLGGLRALEQVGLDARQGMRDLQALLAPRTDEIIRLLDRTKRLAAKAKALAPPQVLCHTDIHAMNLVIHRGALTLLDWEGLKLAPAEHDLFALTGEDFPAFLRSYRRAGGVRELHPDTFGFYFYRRNLEDLTDWLIRILYENDTAAQDRLDLAGLRSDCVDCWPYLEPSITQVREQLAGLGA